MHMDYLFELTNHSKENTALNQVIDDANRRYQGTFVVITLKGKKQAELKYIRNINRDSVEIQEHKNGREARFVIEHKHIARMEEYLPDVGYYQYDNGGCFIQKLIRRQWKRSFCTDVYHTLRWGSGSMVKSYGLPRTFTHTLDEIDCDSPKVALSKHLACHFDTDKKSLVLLYDESPIANVNHKLKQITVLYPDLLQEIKDYLNKTNLGDVWKLMTIR